MKKIIMGVAAAALMSTAANAAVTYDSATGGFVGKGDVQTAFGWNNSDLQTNAGDVTFSYNTSAEFEVVCKWITNPTRNPQTHRVTSEIDSGISASISGTGRLKNQVTGFILGAADTSGGGSEVPTVGARCGDFEGVDGNSDGVIETVTPVGTSGDGGLFVHWNGQSVLLPNS